MSVLGDRRSVRGHGLVDAELAAFVSRARQLGHDVQRLLDGEEVETFAPVPTLEQLRGLCQAGDTERRARAAVFFHPAIALRTRLGQGVHDRCEAFAFADGVVEAPDRARLAMHLPFASRQVSVLHRRVAAGEVWDVTVAHRRLGVDDRDDLFNVVNVGELVIEPGGRVIVQGNLLVFGCQHLQHTGAAGSDYQLGVLPTPHSVDRRLGPMHGRPAIPGASGGAGRTGHRPAGVQTMIGFALSAPIGEQMNATNGTDGGRGGNGASGRTGGATKTAEITIARLTGTLTLLAGGGTGGRGGAGGDGGDGGAGGDAAPGFRATTGPVEPGLPGDGARGGDGGDGGRGGHGGLCSNVFVTLPESMTAQLHAVARPALGGPGGPEGRPGAGGPGGTIAGNPATASAASGSPGRAGRAGLTRPAPQVFLNARPLTGHAQ
jgi:hypothetical protein